MDRKSFIYSMSLGSAGLAFAMSGCKSVSAVGSADDFDALTYNLLKDWCDGMMANQINAPSDPKTHGMLTCPACAERGVVHARCHDAVYPFMHMAHATGEQKYLDAAINVMAWSKNVTGDDGRWTNDLPPKSWHGTTIFGAIALAEAIHYHGVILDEETLAAWKERLAFAAEGYLWKQFTRIDFTNVNYGLTSVYGFYLIGHVLHEQKYIDRSHEFAKGVKNYFTEPNKLLFGEGKPYDNRSGRNLLPVDLGYNVEESLNGAILYALEVNDNELLELLTTSMNSHLEFMLPDGAWDNSWGTRQAKWSYWGSRTSDGCQPGFSMMAGRNPAFGTAAYKNAELLRRCTADGLLHGGPHYVSHGIKPCIHHTFAHAKVMAFVQDNKDKLAMVNTSTPLPRETADGIKEFPELAVWLTARGPWRGTVSAYDSQYKTKGEAHIQQATGGSLAVLFHEKVGTVMAASMADYVMVEPLNMQPLPGEDFAFTPRIETAKEGTWFTNLYDLKADVKTADDGKQIRFDVKASLNDRAHQPLKGDVSDYKLGYRFDAGRVTIHAASADGSVSQNGASLVVPIMSASGEKVTRVSDKRIEIHKPGGTVVVESTAPMKIKQSEKGRIFNMVPGMECVPIIIELPRKKGMKATCSISVVV
ncbi:hypothetical protein PDESU_01681 [Pontiella desulfatans]|uniref:Uncharacterized protein n=1 Tax=Pontiella desulfatans TaxID=2750659 RepID=A0A6C2TZS7_PONDE|nr:hypothetical protein [Pontiella desulfatans]VGO13127.1 hypothetical protein PDESU_01681 [Pontiella desulfatans]